MVYSLDHAESAQQLVFELWKNMQKDASPAYIIPRLYLISDILYNCAAASSVPNGWVIRTEFEGILPDIFEYLNHIYTYFYTGNIKIGLKLVELQVRI